MAKYFIRKFSMREEYYLPGGKTLVETRKKACKIAKQLKGKRIGIYKEDKNHISAGRYMPKLVEDIEYTPETDDYYLVQWTTNRHYRVSPKTGNLLDMNRNWRYY